MDGATEMVLRAKMSLAKWNKFPIYYQFVWRSYINLLSIYFLLFLASKFVELKYAIYVYSCNPYLIVILDCYTLLTDIFEIQTHLPMSLDSPTLLLH